jgi:hypothetical protein
VWGPEQNGRIEWRSIWSSLVLSLLRKVRWTRDMALGCWWLLFTSVWLGGRAAAPFGLLRQSWGALSAELFHEQDAEVIRLEKRVEDQLVFNVSSGTAEALRAVGALERGGVAAGSVEWDKALTLSKALADPLIGPALCKIYGGQTEKGELLGTVEGMVGVGRGFVALAALLHAEAFLPQRPRWTAYLRSLPLQPAASGLLQSVPDLFHALRGAGESIAPLIDTWMRVENAVWEILRDVLFIPLASAYAPMVNPAGASILKEGGGVLAQEAENTLRHQVRWVFSTLVDRQWHAVVPAQWFESMCLLSQAGVRAPPLGWPLEGGLWDLGAVLVPSLDVATTVPCHAATDPSQGALEDVPVAAALRKGQARDGCFLAHLANGTTVKVPPTEFALISLVKSVQSSRPRRLVREIARGPTSSEHEGLVSASSPTAGSSRDWRLLDSRGFSFGIPQRPGGPCAADLSMTLGSVHLHSVDDLRSSDVQASAQGRKETELSGGDTLWFSRHGRDSAGDVWWDCAVVSLPIPLRSPFPGGPALWTRALLASVGAFSPTNVLGRDSDESAVGEQSISATLRSSSPIPDSLWQIARLNTAWKCVDSWIQVSAPEGGTVSDRVRELMGLPQSERGALPSGETPICAKGEHAAIQLLRNVFGAELLHLRKGWALMFRKQLLPPLPESSSGILQWLSDLPPPSQTVVAQFLSTRRALLRGLHECMIKWVALL